jgi:predicted adenylyl cyclase CyaB
LNLELPPSRNIELKARLSNLAQARAIAERLATSQLGILRQRDTYFNCRRGRLKLREIEGGASQLIAYQRADRPDAKVSDYRLLEFSSPDIAQQLRELLDTSLGIAIVVDKNREVFLYHNVRIHLDEVSGLGAFLEFEAVVGDEIEDAAAYQQLAWLRNEFHIHDADLMPASYSDMLSRQAQPHLQPPAEAEGYAAQKPG